MHDAIYAQPGALRLVARGQGDAIERRAMRLRGLDHVLLTGVGHVVARRARRRAAPSRVSAGSG